MKRMTLKYGLKLFFAFALNITLANLSLAQGWEQVYPTDELHFNQISMQTPDGGYLIAGLSLGANHIGIMRLDQEGEQIWLKQHELEVDGIGNNIFLKADNTFYIVGHRYSTSDNDYDGVIWHFNANGDLISQEEVAENLPDTQTALVDILPNDEGGYVLVRSVFAADIIAQRVELLSYDENEVLLWTNSYPAQGTIFPTPQVKLILNEDGDYLLHYVSDFDQKSNIVKVDQMGQDLWDPASMYTPHTFVGIAPTIDGGVRGLREDSLTIINSQGIIDETVHLEGIVEDYYNLITQTSDGNLLIAAISNTDVNKLLLNKITPEGTLIWSKEIFDIPTSHRYQNFALQAIDGGFLIHGAITDLMQFTDNDEVIIKTDENGNVLPNEICGRIFWDQNLNCILEDSELVNWEGWIVSIEDENGHIKYETTDENGQFCFRTDLGVFDVVVYPPNNIWDICNEPEVTFSTYFEEEMVYVGVSSAVACPMLEVYSSSFPARPCFTSTIVFHYNNMGTMDAEGTVINVRFDDDFIFSDANVPYSYLGDNIYEFEVGWLPIGEQGTFTVEGETSCDAILGSVVCIYTEILADNTCEDNFDGAQLRVEGSCDTEEVEFRILNEGSGDMSEMTSYFVIEDNIILMHGEVDLDAGQDEIIPVEINPFSTYRIEVQQESSFPQYLGSPVAALSLENCNGLNPGLVNAFPYYDSALDWDRFCTVVTAAYDPNDKQALPTGLEEEHYIPRNTQLKYTIRFQNTGTDTAFTVILRDQLSEHLDVTSFRPGASSHPYSVQLEGTGELQFTFNNILLPDSTTNEAASQGFVQFEIDQKANLPLGTVIYNEAAIYFDFNEPIITNETWHTIGENYLEVISSNTEEIKHLEQVKISPNPFKEEFILNLDWEPKQGQLLIYHTDGMEIGKWELNSKRTIIQMPTLPSGIYFFEIIEDGIISHEGKLVKIE